MRSRRNDPWSSRLVSLLRQMAGTDGEHGGEAPIVSMGTTGPPLVEEPIFILDYIVSDGAQVTRPSLDPYREPVETYIYLLRGDLRLSMPLMISGLEGLTPAQLEVVASTCYRLGVMLEHKVDARQDALVVRRRYILSPRRGGKLQAGCPYILDVDPGGRLDGLVREVEEIHEAGGYAVARLPSVADGAVYAAVSRVGFDALLIDEDLEGGEDLELAVSEADSMLKQTSIDGAPARWSISIIAVSDRIRGSHDVFKLLGLGAEVIGIRRAWRIATDYSLDMPPESLGSRVENLLLAMQKEIKLLAGAAGVSSLHSSVVGNRELFRSIELAGEVSRRIGVRPAGT